MPILQVASQLQYMQGLEAMLCWVKGMCVQLRGHVRGSPSLLSCSNATSAGLDTLLRLTICGGRQAALGGRHPTA